jgi:kinesin family member 6/9
MVKQTIQIFCRIKPTKAKKCLYEIENREAGDQISLSVPKDASEGYINNKKEEYRFRFERIFDQTTAQNDIFQSVAEPVVDNVLSGYNGTIFAYGQTGSGKTFTITGGPESYDDRGIIPRTISYFFESFSKRTDYSFTMHISYLEIYNENGYDLLDQSHQTSKLEDLPKVVLMEDEENNIHLKNLSVHQATNEDEALNLLFLGDTNRMIAETPMNMASTRSHCIFTIHVTSRETGSATIRKAKLHLVDLAGSERVSKTNVNGLLLTEAKYINLSLHYLEQVIVSLAEKNRTHVPYRNSMMTSVLRDSLGGNCMTSMIATCSVDKRNLDESISTCRFAQRVALIKNEALINEELDPNLIISRLKKEVEVLKNQLLLSNSDGSLAEMGDLSADDIEKLKINIQNFLDTTDTTDSTLNVGIDMRKINFCFNYLKELYIKMKSLSSMSLKNGNDSNLTIVDASLYDTKEMKDLKNTLRQRDNEISILVNMLKKEKKRTDNHIYEPSNSDENNQSKSNGRIILKNMSMGRQEAFEIYKRDYDGNPEIDEQKLLLKKNYAEAKLLGEKINTSRNKLNHLKVKSEDVYKRLETSYSDRLNSEYDSLRSTMEYEKEK